MIVSGTVHIIHERDDKVITSCRAPYSFGELGFITGKGRTMGARVGSTPVQLLKLDFDTYARFLMEHNEQRVHQIAADIQTLDGLKDLTQSALLNISALTAREVHKARKRVHTQAAAGGASGSPMGGPLGQEIFWIVRGEAEVPHKRHIRIMGRSRTHRSICRRLLDRGLLLRPRRWTGGVRSDRGDAD